MELLGALQTSVTQGFAQMQSSMDDGFAALHAKVDAQGLQLAE